MKSTSGLKLKRYEVTGCFFITVEADEPREAKEKAGRILRADGIGHSVIEVREL